MGRAARNIAGSRSLFLFALVTALACSSGGSGGSGNPIAPGPQPPAQNPAPQVALLGESSVDADRPVTLIVQATDDDGIAEIVIAWGDGTSDRLALAGATSHQAPVTHTYGRVGVFRVEASATDSRQATGRATLSITTRGGNLDVGLDHSSGSARLIARASLSVGTTNSSVLDGEVASVRDLVPGDHQVTAVAVRPDCAIDGDATRTVRIDAGSSARVDFSITCAFTPEERIVYNTLDPQGNDSDVSSVRPDGSDRRQLTGLSDLAFPVWSPDGTRILAGWQTLWIMNFDGTEATALGAGRRPAWSPDGRRIAFVQNGDLVIADLEGRVLKNLVSLTQDSGALDDQGPSWSPDGSTIAFHRNGVIHLIEVDGSGLRALVPGVLASWMPDGNRILYVDAELGQIASMRMDGTDVNVLTNQPGGAGYPDASPSGHKILFHSPRMSVDARIWSMNPDGSDPQVIEGIPSGAEHASWGPP